MKKNKKILLIVLLAAVSLLTVCFAAACAKQPLDALGVTSIEIETPPSKTVYTEGEKFEPAGMKVIAHYEDSSMSYVDGYTWTPSGELSAEDSKVTVSYKGKSASVDIFVNLKIPEGAVEETYRFEAECCEIDSTPADDGKVAMVSDESSASGGQCLEYVGNAKSTTLTFNIYSNSKANAVLLFNMGLREKVFTFNTMFDLTVNGKAANPETDVEFPVMRDGAKKYYDWFTAEICRFVLEEGENTIVLTKKASTINLDFIEIKTVAEVGWKTEHENGHAFGEWNIGEQPSFSAAGLAYRRCATCRLLQEYTLPAIAPEYYNEQVTPAEEGADKLGVSKWTFKDAENLGLNVNVETAIENIVISGLAKKNYIGDETLDLSGLTVTVVYFQSEGNVEKQVTDYTVSKAQGAPLAVGDTVTVTYKGITVDTGIVVTENAVEKLIITPPEKTAYFDDEKLDTTGLKVTAVYSDGTEEEIEDYAVDDATKDLDAGEVKFTVTAMGITAEFTVTVTAVELNGIEVDGNTVTAKFNKGDKVLSPEDYTLTLSSDNSSFIVGYTYKQTTKTQELAAKAPLRLEAEALTVNDVANKYKNGNKYETYHSGEVSNVSGMGFLLDYTNNSTITIKVYSEKAALVKFIMAADCNSGKSYDFSKAIPSLKVGEETVKVNIGTITGIDCFTWQRLDIADLLLKEGENVITVEIYDVNKLYVDYFELIANETLTNADEPTGHKYSDWVITQAPTESSAGRAYRYCGICLDKEETVLPALSGGAYTEVASVEATDTVRGYKTLKFTSGSGEEIIFTMTTEEASGTATAYKLEVLKGELDGLSRDGSSNFVGANGKKGTVTFKFNLSEKATVKLAINTAKGNAVRYYMADWARMTIDNEAIALDDTKYLSKRVSGWYEVSAVDVAVLELDAGEHTVTLRILGMPGGNLEAITITTVATLTANALADSGNIANATNVSEAVCNQQGFSLQLSSKQCLSLLFNEPAKFRSSAI